MKYYQIIAIEEVSCDSFEYDIGVDEISNFYADDILVHNCKADGMRCNVLFDHDTSTVTFRGRSGKVIDLLGEPDVEFIKLGQRAGSSVVFDGELIVLEKDGTTMARKKGNGILNGFIKLPERLDRIDSEIRVLEAEIEQLKSNGS